MPFVFPPHLLALEKKGQCNNEEISEKVEKKDYKIIENILFPSLSRVTHSLSSVVMSFSHSANSTNSAQPAYTLIMIKWS